MWRRGRRKQAVGISGKKKPPVWDGGEANTSGMGAEQMTLPEFVLNFRQRVQGELWIKADKTSVGDLMKLWDLEKETQNQVESKQPRELRVVWINRKDDHTE
jgi:hypothetical protein